MQWCQVSAMARDKDHVSEGLGCGTPELNEHELECVLANGQCSGKRGVLAARSVWQRGSDKYIGWPTSLKPSAERDGDLVEVEVQEVSSKGSGFNGGWTPPARA